MTNDGISQLSFVPTTNFWDPGQIQDMSVNSQDFKDLIIRLYENINIISTVINAKESGFYDRIEWLNNQKFFCDPLLTSATTTEPEFRAVFRKVIDFGALPNTATKTVAHQLDVVEPWSFTRIYATASKQTAPLSYIPIPYASTLGDHIELFVDDTNVSIRTLSDWTAWTKCYVILEYIKI